MRNLGMLFLLIFYRKKINRFTILMRMNSILISLKKNKEGCNFYKVLLTI
jgi:hypothetical protein